jgi:2-keto-4-pentenoate hydratase/2-oxohepta-3-ene-1,7-dioic acid hydratase in catechol pathway
MGQREPRPPVVFLKPAAALVDLSAPLVIPDQAGEVHHEVELVLGLSFPLDLDGRGHALSLHDADRAIVAFTVGLDLTLRDRQSAAKQAGEPWAASKGFPGSAPVAPLRTRHPSDRLVDGVLRLEVGGAERQRASLASMTLSPPEIVRELSRSFPLATGDLVFTGTPAGVGPLCAGDRVVAELAPWIRVETRVAG